MQDKSIDGALLALRKQIIREDGDGLEHVEALLRLRAVHMPRVLPVRCDDAAMHGHMKRLVLQGIRTGHRTQQELSAYVAAHRPEITPEQAYKRTSQVLANLRRRGVVGRMGREWGLAP